LDVYLFVKDIGYWLANGVYIFPWWSRYTIKWV